MNNIFSSIISKDSFFLKKINAQLQSCFEGALTSNSVLYACSYIIYIYNMVSCKKDGRFCSPSKTLKQYFIGKKGLLFGCTCNVLNCFSSFSAFVIDGSMLVRLLTSK